LLVATSIGIHFYALPELELEQLLPCEGEPMALAYRPDGGAFASLERSHQKGRMLVRVYDAAHCDVLHRWEAELPGARHQLHFGDGSARLWDFVEKRTARSFGGWPLPRGVAGPVLSEFPAFSEDGNLLGWSCVDRKGDRHVRVWRTAGEELGRLPTNGECLAMHPQSGLVACGDDQGIVELWQLDSAKLLGSRKAHLRPITCLAFSPDGARLASAASDGSVVVWALEAPSYPVGPPRYHVPAPCKPAPTPT
jgi:WD40 repeat protein